MTIENLLLAVQEKKKERLPFLLEKLINRITNPPIAVPNACLKHTVLRDQYKHFGILKTLVHRNSRSSLPEPTSRTPSFRAPASEVMQDKVYAKYEEAGKAYHNAECTCASGLASDLLSPTAICVSCGDQLGLKNNCRHPIHLSFKKGELLQCKQEERSSPFMHHFEGINSV